MADGRYLRNAEEVRLTAAAAVAGGECWQLPDGRAAVHTSLDAKSTSDRVNFSAAGQQMMTKATGFVAIAGNPAYWDHSANNITYRRMNDRDFYAGCFAEDAASADTVCVVNLNVQPGYVYDMTRDGATSVIVGTAAAGGFGYPQCIGGSLLLALSATNEAQKVDILGVEGFAPGSNFVLEAAFRVNNGGDGTAPDLTIGVASGTHATDFQSVAEFVTAHVDGQALDIFVQSDDGTTDVAPTDSTIDFAVGTAKANQVHLWIDARDHTDIQVYLNGANVLPGTTFTLTAAAGPLFPIVHLEKTASTNVFQVMVDTLRVRLMEQPITG